MLGAYWPWGPHLSSRVAYETLFLPEVRRRILEGARRTATAPVDLPPDGIVYVSRTRYVEELQSRKELG